MSETLAARVGRVLTASAHALLDKVEDGAPESMMEQSIREVDKVVDEVRAELGRVAANRHLAQQQHAELNRRHGDLAIQIEEAIGANRDDLAAAAVARQVDIEAQLPVLEKALAGLVTEEGELKAYVEALMAKKRDMSEALSAFRTSRARAESPTGAAGSIGAAGKLDRATASFERVFERQTGLTPTAHAADLAQGAKLKELEDLMRSNKIAERLAQVKANRR